VGVHEQEHAGVEVPGPERAVDVRLVVSRRQEPGLDLKEPSVCEDVPALLRPRGELVAVGGRNEVSREIPRRDVPRPHNTPLDKRGQDVRI